MKREGQYPLLTYVTVAKNAERTIETCIRSVLAQRYPSIEYIVIDGASGDGTMEIVHRYKKEIDEVVSEPDAGIYDAMNKGIRLSHGEVLCFINADDALTERASDLAMRHFCRGDADLVCGRRKLLNQTEVVSERVYGRFPLQRSVFRYIQMFHQSTYAKKSLFEQLGGFDTRYALLADYIWESKAIDAGARLLFTEEELAVFRYGGSSCRNVRQRDREWVAWIGQLFPQIPEKDAQALLFCLDRGRHPLFDVRTVHKMAAPYLQDPEFAGTYCGTLLTACIEEAEDVLFLFSRGEGKRKRQHLNPEEVLAEKKEMEKTLVRLYENGAVMNAQDVEKQVRELIPVKRELNRLYFSLYREGGFSEGMSAADRLLRRMTLGSSKLAARSEFMSRHFYSTLRDAWVLLFGSRFVRN